tara:strand:+ start:275 stop:784 length:510 start_codon:yes stop_codon:yes gene_type:complete
MANECKNTTKVTWGSITAEAVPGAPSIVAVSWPYRVTCNIDACPGRESTDPRFCVTPVPSGVITKYLYQVWDMGPSLSHDMKMCLIEHDYDLSFCMELIGVDYEDIFDMGIILLNTPEDSDIRFDSKCRCVGRMWDGTAGSKHANFQNSNRNGEELAAAAKRSIARDNF